MGVNEVIKMGKYTTITVKKETKARLASICKKDEMYDALILKLVEMYEKMQRM